MEWIKNLEKVKEPMFGATLLGGLLIFSPGLSYLFFFAQWTVTNLDILKLLSLALAIFVPFFILNSILLAVIISDVDEKNKVSTKENVVMFTSIFVSIFLSAGILYFGLLFAYFYNMSFHKTLAVDIFIQFIVLLSISHSIIKHRIRPK